MRKNATDILVVENLTKAYDRQKVVDNVSFTVKSGEVLGILGPNGAGKTTTIEMIETLRPIDSGSATLAGIDVAKQPRRIKQVIGVQLQSSAFFDNLNLLELLKMYAAMYGVMVNPMELLKKVQLSEKAKSVVKNLSGGQQQRFSIAVALVNKPKVLFLDEPTTGLDPQARRNMWDLIAEINQEGVTVVMTTHYMEEAEKLCDRVAIMDGGKIIALDTPEKLVKDLLKRGFVSKKVVREADLEDVFIDLTGKELRE